MTTTSSEPKIHLHLNAPDTTIIHRAALLGLWMTLKQLEKRFPNSSQRVGEISWKLTPNSVSLDWKGQDKIVLDWLLKQAFQVNNRGLISLTGLNPQSMPLINKIHLHQALTATLLQHNQFVTTIADQYKASGTKSLKNAPYLLLCLLINLAIPGQFHLLLKGKPNPQSKQHNPQEYIDDDVMGFMVTEAAKKNQKGTINARQGALGTNRAISLTPYDGTTFNYYNSGEKDKLSIHSTNVHNTCYQYCFALDSKHLINPSRILNVIDAFISLSQVGGHINDSLFDFSPESMVLRWTNDNCPRFLYCFEQDENQEVIALKLIEQVEAEDIKPEELWIGGEVTKRLIFENAHIFRGIKKTAENLKVKITEDLKLPNEESKKDEK